jgi:hypothetical protein
VKRYGKYRRKVSWIVKRLENIEEKVRENEMFYNVMY